jgi:hypothetical protein
MDKLVYLFELDSVRATPREIEIGQQAMFEEIVENGNRVVLSLNQLTDSQAFLAAVKDKDVYPHILELFKKGALKVSHYGNVRTSSQYIQNAIEKCSAANENTFIFSALPVLQTQRDLLERIHGALQYSDPAIIREMAEEKRREADAALTEKRESLLEEVRRLEFIERYIRMILLLSTEPLSWNPPTEEQNPSFLDRMDAVLSHFSASEGLCGEAVGVLAQVREEILEETGGNSFINNRSVWVKALCARPASDPVSMAEAIVDLCYNYTIEGSVVGVSRHFQPQDPEMFFRDFQIRLEQYWDGYKAGIHIFHKGDTAPSGENSVRLPHWATAVRLFEAHGTAAPAPRLYEENYRAERFSWQMRILKTFLKTVFFSLVYITLLVVVDLVMGNFEDFAVGEEGLGASQTLITAVLTSLVFGIAGSVVMFLAKLPDFLDIFKSIFHLGQDVLIRWLSPKGKAYINPQLMETTHEKNQ